MYYSEKYVADIRCTAESEKYVADIRCTESEKYVADIQFDESDRYVAVIPTGVPNLMSTLQTSDEPAY